MLLLIGTYVVVLLAGVGIGIGLAGWRGYRNWSSWLDRQVALRPLYGAFTDENLAKKLWATFKAEFSKFPVFIGKQF